MKQVLRYTWVKCWNVVYAVGHLLWAIWVLLFFWEGATRYYDDDAHWEQF